MPSNPPKSGGCISVCCDVLVTLLLLPFMLLGMVIGSLLWVLLTVTGIGPLLQCHYARKDRRLLDRDTVFSSRGDLRLVEVPVGVNAASGDKPYNIAVRFTTPASSSGAKKQYPICIPNGLGATLVTISVLHEALVEKGYTVLSYDRLGVGFSDPNPTSKSPAAADVVAEMRHAMISVLPADTEWVLIGPSMGSIVGQCFVAAYPQAVVGFLNMDGLPYPFSKVESAFNFAGKLYFMYSHLVWTGMFRPFVGPMLGRPAMRWVISKSFSLAITVAQMNDKFFYSNLGLEMTTMMNCCASACSSWGDSNLLTLDDADLATLARAAPSESVVVDEMAEVNTNRSVTEERSASELGEAWEDDTKVVSVIERLLKKMSAGSIDANASSLESPLVQGLSTASLTSKWTSLVVRVMSARNHDFGFALANAFYSQEMKNLAAAEHTVHWRLARSGRRTIYPKLSHMHIFAQTREIIRHVDEIYEELSS